MRDAADSGERAIRAVPGFDLADRLTQIRRKQAAQAPPALRRAQPVADSSPGAGPSTSPPSSKFASASTITPQPNPNPAPIPSADLAPVRRHPRSPSPSIDEFDRGISRSRTPGRLFDPGAASPNMISAFPANNTTNPTALPRGALLVPRDQQQDAMSDVSSAASPRRRGPYPPPGSPARRAAAVAAGQGRTSNYPPNPQTSNVMLAQRAPAEPSRRLFEPSRDDPFRFASSTTMGSSRHQSATPSVATTSYTSDTRSLASSAFTLSSATSGTSVDSGSAPRNDGASGGRKNEHAPNVTPLVAELKRLYREICDHEKKLVIACAATESIIDEEPSRYQISSSSSAPSASTSTSQEPKWLQLVVEHKALVELDYRLLEIATGPSIPASVQSIPDRYNITQRLWSFGIHRMIVMLRRASATSPVALEILTDFIYYAYKFYTELYEEKNLAPYRGKWLEALGDLASYRMAVAAHERASRAASNSASTSPSSSVPGQTRTALTTVTPDMALTQSHLAAGLLQQQGVSSPLPTSAAGGLAAPATTNMFVDAQGPGSALAQAALPVTPQHPFTNTQNNDDMAANLFGAGQGNSPIPSVGIRAAALMGDPDERDIWRSVAREWYALGLKDTPGAGRLQYHLGSLCRDSKGQEARGVYHFVKSFIAIHPFDTAREGLLSFYSPQLQLTLGAPSASASSLFLHIIGQLFTRIDLDQVQPNLARFIERLELDENEEQGGEESEWIMSAVLAIGALLEFGRPESILRRACGMEASATGSAGSTTGVAGGAPSLSGSSLRDPSRPTSWSTDAGSISGGSASRAQPWVAEQAAAAAAAGTSASRMEEDRDDDPSHLSRPMEALSTHANAIPAEDSPRAKQSQLVFNLAMEVAFTTLGYLIKSKPFMPATSPYVKPALNPYITVLITFLASVFKYSNVLPLMERAIPWGALADILGTSLRRSGSQSSSSSTSSAKDASLFPTGQLLPEDWSLRGMEWTNRRVYERGFWAKPHKGPLGTLVQGEMDVIVPSNAVMSASYAAARSSSSSFPLNISGAGADGLDGVVEDDDDEDEMGDGGADSMDLDGPRRSRSSPRLSPAQALGVVRWKRLRSAAEMFTRVVPGFRWDERSTSVVIVEDLADKIALWEQERLDAEEERLERARKIQAQAMMRPRRTADEMEVDGADYGDDVLIDDDGREDVGDDDEDDDPEDGEQVRELKARRRYLQNLVRMSQRTSSSRPLPPAPRRSVRSSAPIRPPLKVLPGYTVLVIDTNILLSSLSVVSALVDGNQWPLVVPLAVVTELDGISKNTSPLGNAATDALNYLLTAVPSHSTLKVQTSKGNYLRTLNVRSENIDFSYGSNHDRNMDDLILRSATWQAEHFFDHRVLGQDLSVPVPMPEPGTSKVIVLSFDRNLRLKARSRKLDAADEKDMAAILATAS